MALKIDVKATLCQKVMNIGNSEKQVFLTIIIEPVTGLGHTITVSVNHRPVLIGVKDVFRYPIGLESKTHVVASIVDIRKGEEFESKVTTVLETEDGPFYSHTCVGSGPDHVFETIKSIAIR